MAPAASARAQAVFSRTLGAYLRGRTGTVAVMARDAATGVTVASDAHVASYAASIVKLDILAALLLQHQDDGELPSAAEQALARRMIASSDNDAASQLWRRIGAAQGLADANRRLGLEETVPGADDLWGLTRTTVADQLRLLSAVTGSGGAVVGSDGAVVGSGSAVVGSGSAVVGSDGAVAGSGVAGTAGALGGPQQLFAVRLLRQVIDEQRWGVSAVAAGLDAVTVKNGWLPYSGDGRRWVVNSVGRVRTARGATLLIAVLTRYSPDLGYGIATVEQVSRIAAVAVEGV